MSRLRSSGNHLVDAHEREQERLMSDFRWCERCQSWRPKAEVYCIQCDEDEIENGRIDMEFIDIGTVGLARTRARGCITLGKSAVLIASDVYDRYVSGRGDNIKIAVSKDGKFLKITPGSSGYKVSALTNKHGSLKGYRAYASKLWRLYRMDTQRTDRITFTNGSLICELEIPLEPVK